MECEGKYEVWHYQKLCFLIVIFSFSVFTATSQGFLQIQYRPDTIEVIENSLYTDTTAQLALQDIVEKENFLPLQPENKFGHGNYAYWVRFKFSDQTNVGDAICNTLSMYDWVDLYSPTSDGVYTLQKTGFKIPILSRSFSDNNASLPIKIVKGKAAFYYIRIVSKEATNIVFGVSSNAIHHNQSVRNFTYYGFFFGIILIAALYSLILFLRIKEKAYLYYTLYVVCFGLFAAMVWDLITIFPFINFVGWNKNFYTIPFASMTCFLLLYARSFLGTKQHLPVFHKLLTALVIGRILVYFTGFAIDSDELYSPKTDDLFLLGAFAAGIARLRQGYKPARYYLLAFSITYLGFLVHAFGFLKEYTTFFMTPFDFFNAGAYEIILFSFGLAERFRLLKADKEKSDAQTIYFLEENNQLKDQIIVQLHENEQLKDKVNRELEQKVKARTKQLAQVNEELNAQSVEIERINTLLQQDNSDLKDNVKKIVQDRVMQKRVTFEEFMEIYPDDEACLKYLATLKWPQNQFTCRKCGNNKYSKGNSPHSRRCSKCNHIERIYTDTIFGGIKFPILKAFYMLFLAGTGKNMTIDEIATALNMRKQTCWAFKKKIKELEDNRNLKQKNKDGWSHFIMNS